MIAAVGWVGTILVLVSYFVGGKTFDRANILLCVPVALPAIVAGAYSSAAISLAFGAIAMWRLACG